ncbi:uncharacterized protein (DUF169 family) [Roseovarius sp. MBR-51]
METQTTGETAGAATLATATAELVDLLKLRTLPIGLKLFEYVDEMMLTKGIRTPRDGKVFSTCQLVTQSRYNGTTLGIVHDNLLPNSNCGGVVGLNVPGENYLSGEKMDGVWFDNREAARAHQAQMPRVPPGRYSGLVASPLRNARLDPPDICMFYATPGQMILFVNGLQRKNYKRYDLSITGESACADSWGRALETRETSISIPCYAERRFGGVADDELLIAMPPDEFLSGIDGLKGLHKTGLRYPITPYSVVVDPAEGLSASYGAKKR